MPVCLSAPSLALDRTADRAFVGLVASMLDACVYG
jgi:hypothetical protein